MISVVFWVYYLPMILSMPILYFIWWPILKKDFFRHSDVRMKHAIAFCFAGLAISVFPMVNWLPVACSILYGLMRVFEDDDSDHWWNKKF